MAEALRLAVRQAALAPPFCHHVQLNTETFLAIMLKAGKTVSIAKFVRSAIMIYIRKLKQYISSRGNQ